MKDKRNGFVLAGAVLGTIAVCAAIASYWSIWPRYGIGTMLDNIIQIFTSRTLWGILAVAFLWSGYAVERRSLVLTGAIFLCIAPVASIVTSPLFILPIIFSFVGYAKMRPRPEFQVLQDIRNTQQNAGSAYSAGIDAQYVVDTAKSIKDTVDTITKMAADGSCDSALADEGRAIMNEALDTVRTALTVAKMPNTNTTKPTIDAAMLMIDSLHSKALSLIPRTYAHDAAESK